MKKYINIILIFLFILVCYTGIAGPPPPPPTGGPGCWPPPCIPIDGGIVSLIAAGAIYGGKKLYNKRLLKQKN